MRDLIELIVCHLDVDLGIIVGVAVYDLGLFDLITSMSWVKTGVSQVGSYLL